jgi:hypothetical protein
MAFGRPTYYSPEVVEQSIHYLEHFNEDPYNDQIPSIVGLCKVIKRSRSTIYRWIDDEDKIDFRDITESIQDYQEHRLLNGGLSGELNSAITKLILGKHGYSDKSEVAGAGGDPLIPKVSDTELMRRAAFVIASALKAEEES